MITSFINLFGVSLQAFIGIADHVKDKETVYVFARQVPAKVPDDFLYLSVYRHHAVPVALY